jgi:hypothetical protein
MLRRGAAEMSNDLNHGPRPRFAIGQRVKLRQTLERLLQPEAEYEVVRLLPALLPSEGSSFQYVLRDSRSGRQRVTTEDRLTGSNAATVK